MELNIQIRPWKREDVAQLASIANNKKIWLNVRDRFPHPYTVHDGLQWVNYTINQHPIVNLAITVNGNVAGGIGVVPKDDVYRKTMEIGYFLGEHYWGQGVATKAVALLIEFIKQHFTVVRLYAEVFEHNKASMRVLEKNGFHLESIREKSVIKNNVIMNDYVWVKLL